MSKNKLTSKAAFKQTVIGMCTVGFLIFCSGCINAGNKITSYEYDIDSRTYKEVYPRKTDVSKRIFIRSDIEYVSQTKTIVDYSKPLSPGQVCSVFLDPLGFVRPTFQEMKTVYITEDVPVRRRGFERPKTEIYNVQCGHVVNNVVNY